MAEISPRIIEEIRSRVSIVDVVSSRIQLKRAAHFIMKKHLPLLLTQPMRALNALVAGNQEIYFHFCKNMMV